MPGIENYYDDSGIRVVVTPSQSSYFAGEPFSVSITFTNTRSIEAGPSKPHSHKRGSHSISSAPLARPPTSPGTPRTIAQPTPTQLQGRNVDEIPARRGLVGKEKAKEEDELPSLIEQRRKRLLGKSLSVSIAPHELDEQLGEASTVKSASYAQSSFNGDHRHAPSSPRISSPLARSDSFSLSQHHPHARKQSILDGSPELVIEPPVDPSLPYTPAASTSTFSLALDPIAEGSGHLTPYQSTPSIASPSIEAHSPVFMRGMNGNSVNSVYASYPSAPARHSQKSLQVGIGRPPNSARAAQPPRSAFSSTSFTHPNSELILYSYAQLKGTLSIIPVPGVQPTTEQRQTLNSARAALLKPPVKGGGRMDISSSLQQPLSAPPGGGGHRRRPTHGRSSSFSHGLLSLLSPSSLTTSPLASPSAASPRSASSSYGHGPRSSISSLNGSPAASPALNGRFPNSGSVGLGLGLGLPGNESIGGEDGGISRLGSASPLPKLGGMLQIDDGMGMDEEVDPEAPLPTFEVQPTMLAVDLSLMPGESRTYRYTVNVPDEMPPTFKGRAIKFSYELLIGTCRAGAGSSGASSANSVSRLMKVPIRMYNNVMVGRTPRPYDVLWPVSIPAKTNAARNQGQVVEETGKAFKPFEKLRLVSSPSPSMIGNSLDDLRDYASRLLLSFPEPGKKTGVRIKLPAESISPVPQTTPNPSPYGSPYGPWKSNGGYGGGNGGLPDSTDLKRLEREMERGEEEGGLSGCREAVEILTRNPKKASYDVNKDGVKVAVLTFPKAAYRLGETVLGVVELNKRAGRARVLQLSAMLEAHESLPSSIAPQGASRYLRRVHAEHHSAFTTCALRTTFSLDIPSDASPAFQMRVGLNQPGGAFTTFGGLEWKVRLCLLVAVASETSEEGTEGVRIKQLLRDGPRGEWGSSWQAPHSIAPMENLPKPPAPPQSPPASTPRSWASFFASTLLGTTEEDGDDGEEEETEKEGEKGYDGIKPDLAGGVGTGVNYGGGEDGWTDIKLETVECEVPIRLWPGNTAFRATDIVFDV